MTGINTSPSFLGGDCVNWTKVPLILLALLLVSVSSLKYFVKARDDD
jgi:hypothetical protein